MCGINSVSDAKQDVDKNSCCLDDIQYVQDFTYYYSISEDGEPFIETDHTDGDFRCYHCDGCGEEFETFDEVKEHIC